MTSVKYVQWSAVHTLEPKLIDCLVILAVIEWEGFQHGKWLGRRSPHDRMHLDVSNSFSSWLTGWLYTYHLDV